MRAAYNESNASSALSLDTEPTTYNVILHGYLRIPQDFILLQLFISKEEHVKLQYVSKSYSRCHMEAVSALMQAS